MALRVHRRVEEVKICRVVTVNYHLRLMFTFCELSSFFLMLFASNLLGSRSNTCPREVDLDQMFLLNSNYLAIVVQISDSRYGDSCCLVF